MTKEGQINKSSGNGGMIVAVGSFYPKGHGGKVYLPAEVVKDWRDRGIKKLMLIADPIGGDVILRPLANSELQQQYDRAIRQVVDVG